MKVPQHLSAYNVPAIFDSVVIKNIFHAIDAECQALAMRAKVKQGQQSFSFVKLLFAR